MKRLIYILLLFYSIFGGCISYAESECSEKANAVAQEYFEKNKNRQITSMESLSKEKQREAKIRNMCFGASIDWYFFCEFGTCKNIPETEITSDGITLSQFCEWKNMDCFSDDIEKVFSALQDSNDGLYNLFFSDMNTVIQSIMKDEETLFLVDADNSRCYRTDDNGDTVWHAFAKKKKIAWDSTCASYLGNTHLKELSDAMYKIKNKEGKTALQQTMEWDKKTNLLYSLSEVYGEEGGRKACDELAADISKSNGISVSQAASLIYMCYVFADRKK